MPILTTLDALERKLEESPTPNFGLQVLREEFARLRFAHHGEAVIVNYKTCGWETRSIAYTDKDLDKYFAEHHGHDFEAFGFECCTSLSASP